MDVRNCTKKPVSGTAVLTVTGKGYERTEEFPVSGTDSIIRISPKMALGKDVRLWDEFNPNLYTVKCELRMEADV